ncbi:hypothetical protein ABIA32_002668 [Streptacidiphilus sp. MAP12-20]|uniref:hypothetical protein n=1 Tax=Streptacidiphilus sp. MAP12-20 TaxID=3156299 RepID=UPI003511D15B
MWGFTPRASQWDDWPKRTAKEGLVEIECGVRFDAVRMPEALGLRIFQVWQWEMHCGPLLQASPWVYGLTRPRTHADIWRRLSSDSAVLSTGSWLICPRPDRQHPAAGRWLKTPDAPLWEPTRLADLLAVFAELQPDVSASAIA